MMLDDKSAFLGYGNVVVLASQAERLSNSLML